MTGADFFVGDNLFGTQTREKQILHFAYPMDISVRGAPKRYVQDDKLWGRRTEVSTH